MPMVHTSGQQAMVGASQVSRPVAVQMGRPTSQALSIPFLWMAVPTARLRTPPQDVGHLAALSTQQLVDFCHSLHRQTESKKQLLAEYVKEQGKLLKEREVLQNRKEGLLRSLAGATFADSMIPGQQMTVMATVLSAPSLAAAQDMTRQVEQTGAAPPPPKPMSLGPPNAEAKIQAAPSQDMTCAALESSVTKETTFASPSVDTCEKRPEKHDLRSPVQMIRPEEVSLASPVPPNPESAESQVRHEAATSPSTFAPEVHAPRDVEVHPAPTHPVRPDPSEAVPRTAVQPAGAVWAVEGSAVFAKPQARSAEAESTVEVKPETDAAAEPAELELLQQPQQLQSEAASNTAFSQPRMKPVEEFFSLRAAFVANTPESKVDLVPCSGDAAAGVGAKSDTEQIKVMSPSYGSLDGSSVLPESETMGQERTEAMQINMPEELMARVEDTNIRLTWFFDEDLLERLGPEITFEIRQQSEGIGGRLRVREHWCSAVYFAKGEAVQEQSYVIEGCAPGRPYTFSLRARVPCPGGVQFSEFSDHVIASVPGGKNVASLCSTEASVEIKGEGTLQEMVTAPTTLAAWYNAKEPGLSGTEACRADASRAGSGTSEA
ncbi:unnamed protein product [Durusdinium trenchii]